MYAWLNSRGPTGNILEIMKSAQFTLDILWESQMDHMTIRPHDLHPLPHLHKRIHTCSHTPCCKTLKHHSVITAIKGDDGVLMSTLTSATSLGSQLADN